MPNGGSDCCGTCWFNRTNRGRRDWRERRDDSIPPFCEIRNLPIETPFYTYCANHPHRRPDRDPIPIGPVLCDASAVPLNSGDNEVSASMPGEARFVWRSSPDPEEIRQHLLELLDAIPRTAKRFEYPIGSSVNLTVIQQLGEFTERRAIEALQGLAKTGPDYLADAAVQALDRISGDAVRDP